MSEHTPGPWVWQIERMALHALPNGPNQWGMDICWIDRTMAFSKADAALIAAAPDLLAALKEVVRISDRKHDAWDTARAAIAKATGEAA